MKNWVLYIIFLLLLIFSFVSPVNGYSSYVLWIGSGLFFLMSQIKYRRIELRPGLFIFLMAVFLTIMFSLKISLHVSNSIKVYCDLIAFVLIFVSMIKWKFSLQRIMVLLMGLSFVFSIYGLYGLLASDYWNYVRAISVFDFHSYYAGFLVFIIPITAGLILEKEHSLDKKWLVIYYIVLFFSAINLYFSFSRWGIISLILVLLIGKDLFLKKFNKRIVSRFGIIALCLVFCITSITIYKQQQSKKQGVELDIFLRRIYPDLVSYKNIAFAKGDNYQQSNKEVEPMVNLPIDTRNAFSFRVNYFINALKVIKDHFWLGTGIGGYQSASKQYLQDVRDFASTPHNILLYAFAQIGFLGFFFLFLLFLQLKYLMNRSFKKIKKERKFIYSMIGLGLFSMLLHNLADDSITHPVNAIVFVICLGALVRVGAIRKIHLGPKKRLWVKMFFPMIIALFFLNYGLSSLIADSQFKELRSLNQSEIDTDSYKTIIERIVYFNPFNDYFLFEGAKYFRNNSGSELAFLTLIENAISLDITNYNYHLFLADYYIENNDLEAAQNQLEVAVRYNPVGIPSLYLQLFQVYESQNDYLGIIRKSNDMLNFYPKEVMDSVNWITVLSTSERKDAIAEIYNLRGIAYFQENDLNRAKINFYSALQYNPSNQKALDNIETIEKVQLINIGNEINN